MKRMIDGIINYSVTSGYLSLPGADTVATLGFNFPKCYWPISLSSKPFSVLPGRLDVQSADVTKLCFKSEDSLNNWEAVNFELANANIKDYFNSSLEYRFTFKTKAKRDAFLASFFGKGWTEDSTKFIIPISMVLLPFAGAFDL